MPAKDDQNDVLIGENDNNENQSSSSSAEQNQSADPTCEDIVKHSLEHSTIRGLTRIKKESEIHIKAIWIVGIIAFIITALAYVRIIFLDYRSYPVVTVQKEFIYYQNTEDSETHIKRNFPTVTVCNANPISPSAVKKYGIDSYAEYLNKLATIPMPITDPSKEGEKDRVIEGHIRESLHSLYGYFSYLGLENATKVGHECDNLVISCQLLIRKYYVSVPCEKFVYIRQIQSPNFFNCYLIGLNSDSKTIEQIGIPRGFSLKIYTGEIEYPFPTNIPHGRNEFELDNGILLALQAPGKYPDLTSNSYRLAPGFHHHIAFSAQSRKRLEKPYAGPDCRDTDVLPIGIFVITNSSDPVPEQPVPPLWDLGKHGFSYSHNGQIMSCVNKALMKNCLCLDPDFPVVHHTSWLSKMPLCADIGDGPGDINTTISRLWCMHKVEHTHLPQCAGTSKMECTETIISSDLSAYAWPRLKEQLRFYDEHIKGKPFEHHFNTTFEDIISLLQQKKVSEAKEKLLATTSIKENFLKVTIEERSAVSYVVEDQAKWSFATFLGQVGGTLNLWAGVSFLLIFEIIILGLKLMCHWRNKIKDCKPNPVLTCLSRIQNCWRSS